ncbi:hypothetical protein ACE1CI_08835 [Aerosakkonemataceae cyanobacterium BLCC-F50]|uniref:LAGLIDADG homing endonuclease n=1 Tax=Floridaenema flaviceps BLCC-F50 TaxID=3153642 RepID=A0ABV4XMQ6_9CYAN
MKQTPNKNMVEWCVTLALFLNAAGYTHPTNKVRSHHERRSHFICQPKSTKFNSTAS